MPRRGVPGSRPGPPEPGPISARPSSRREEGRAARISDKRGRIPPIAPPGGRPSGDIRREWRPESDLGDSLSFPSSLVARHEAPVGHARPIKRGLKSQHPEAGHRRVVWPASGLQAEDQRRGAGPGSVLRGRAHRRGMIRKTFPRTRWAIGIRPNQGRHPGRRSGGGSVSPIKGRSRASRASKPPTATTPCEWSRRGLDH
jgi:hypothetical protein